MEGIAFTELVRGLDALKSPGHRVCADLEGRHIVDDYAHHLRSGSHAYGSTDGEQWTQPTAEPTTTTRRCLSTAPLQPHWSIPRRFAGALQNCDALLLAPVYAAGEQPVRGSAVRLWPVESVS